MGQQDARGDRPVVFLSYAWSSESHRIWVRQLADELVANGVEVMYDGYELKPGHETYAYMEQMVTQSEVTKVLCICDQLYMEKADGRRGGVGTETQIITPELYARAKQTKFVPLIRGLDQDGKPHLPVFLKGRFFIDFSDDDRYYDKLEELLRDIYDKPKLPKPPFGPRPSFLTEDSSTLSTAGMARRIEQALRDDSPASHGLIETYVDKFMAGLPAFRLSPEEGQKSDMDDHIWDSIHRFRIYRDDYLKVLNSIALFGRDDRLYQPVYRLLEKTLGLTTPPVGVQYNPIWYDNFRFMRRDLFSCTSALLLRRGRFEAVDLLLSKGYYGPRDGGMEISSFSSFDEQMQSLDNHRNRRLSLNRASVTADLIRETTPTEYFDFEFAMQVDFVLYIRSVLEIAGAKEELLSRARIWYPRTAPYFEHSAEFELFKRARTKPDLGNLMTVMGVPSKREFLERFESGGVRLGDWFQRYGWGPFVMATAKNWPD